jgi:photosystem II stability/assembly factor-like uncharacterized protein
MRCLLVCLVQLLLVASLSFSQDVAGPVHHVSRTLPVDSPRHELSAERPQEQHRTIAQPPATGLVAPSHTWQLLATLPQVILHDVSFPTAKVGYAAGEHGQIWKTTDGGNSWVQVLSAGDNYYFYGVATLSTKDIVISGFYDSNVTYGVFRWSHDGGSTWTGDLSFGSASLQRVRFVKGQDGLIMENPDYVFAHAEFTTDGGATLPDWTSVVSNPNGNGDWFDDQFSLLTNLHARASGINFCTSLTGGARWTCGASVDSIFDGPVFFLNDKYGWVGGGEISPNVEGWIHLTTNGGKSWTGRTLDGPWPIRSVLFLNSVGAGRWPGQCGKELVLVEPFVHPETERQAMEVGRCGSGGLLEHRSIAWLQVSCARAVVNSWCKPTDPDWKSTFDCAAWPLLAAQKASNQ